MNVMNFDDLNCSVALDRKAMSELKGGNCKHLRGIQLVETAWTPYSLMSVTFQGVMFHDGALTRKYSETWKRTRIQTEFSYWDAYYNV